MADKTPTTNFYQNLGGINQKASDYSLDKAQFLNIFNMDFDVPNALQKRPGSTQAIGANASGPINSLHEFVRLDGASYVVAGSDTAMFYRTGTSLTLLDPSWTNGQPTDMLTFLNKLWMANGQHFKSWSGPGVTATPVGLPCSNPLTGDYYNSTNATFFLVGGATMLTWTGDASSVQRGIYVGYSYVRNDGYMGPCDLSYNARNIVYNSASSNGGEYIDDYPNAAIGFSLPSGRGITAVAIWVGVDSVFNTSTPVFIPSLGASLKIGNNNLGYQAFVAPNRRFMSLTLKPGADLSKFWLYTITPTSQFFTASTLGGSIYFTTTLPLRFDSFTGIATGTAAFTGMNFCWFESNTPKYIEQNQNSMFMSGFSNTPSTVWFTELGQPEFIEPEYNIEVRTNDGDRIMGQRTFNNEEIICKQNSFHKIIGDSPENYQLVELSTEYGCLSNKSIVSYNSKLGWLDRKGILEFNGASWEIISTQVEDVFRRMNLNAAKENAVGVHHLYRNQVWWGIPVDGSTKNNLTVVYDYLVNAWTFFDGFNPASFAFVESGLNRHTVWRGDYSGMIHYHGESFFGDNGQGITCLLVPHWDKNKENETWIWRRFFLDVATASGLTGIVTGKIFSDYNLSTVQATFAMYQSAVQSRAEIGVQGKAVTGEFAHHSASLPLLINGYSWAKRYLRNV